MNETPNEDQTSIDRFNDDGGMIVISDDETFPRGEGSKEKPYSTPIGSIDLILRNADYIRDKEGSSAINIEFQGNIYIYLKEWLEINSRSWTK